MERRALLGALLALTLGLGGAGPAKADPDFPDVMGTYNGTFTSMVTGMEGTVVFMISGQYNRRFMGTVTFDTGGVPIGFEFEGTVEGNNRFHGRGTDPTCPTCRITLEFDGVLNFSMPGIVSLTADYILMSPSGEDNGTVTASTAPTSTSPP
jgi:hypothetical protein